LANGNHTVRNVNLIAWLDLDGEHRRVAELMLLNFGPNRRFNLTEGSVNGSAYPSLGRRRPRSRRARRSRLQGRPIRVCEGCDVRRLPHRRPQVRRWMPELNVLALDTLVKQCLT